MGEGPAWRRFSLKKFASRREKRVRARYGTDAVRRVELDSKEDVIQPQARLGQFVLVIMCLELVRFSS